jgi:fatty-acid peroxygenase
MAGSALLAAPGRVLALAGGPDRRDDRVRMVSQVLGARLLLQGIADVVLGRRMRRLDLSVELAHAASMLPVVALSARHRRTASASAALATGLLFTETAPEVMADLGLSLLRQGYRALPRAWQHSGDAEGDSMTCRLLGRRALVVRGGHGARTFYDESLVQRQGAVPPPLANLLFGSGAVHGLDGVEHRERKALFLSAITTEGVQQLGDDVARELEESVRTWPQRGPVRLFDELVKVYGVCALRWAGVDAEPREAAAIALRLASIVDGFGFSPRAYARGWGARLWADRWAARVVREARQGQRHPAPGTMLDVLAHGDGSSLPIDVAGVELLNVVRPTVAVAWLGTFAAVELACHPEYGPVLAECEAREARWHFADEVRRLTPFVPALVGRVRRETSWQGHLVKPGDRLVLDVPGTNRHRSWGDPEQFRPERFQDPARDAFELVPQGGGDARHGHRCPGELVSMTLLDRTLHQLSRTGFSITTADPELRRMPTLPKDGVLITKAEPEPWHEARRH